MTKKNFLRFIAVFMVIVTVLLSVPIQTIAEDTIGPQTEVLENESNELDLDLLEEINTSNSGEISEEVFIVEEDVSKRSQFEKHYLCSDGTYVSVTYPEAIHYLDENQVWQDVDQSLTYNSASGKYTSENGDFSVSFSNKASLTNMAQMSQNGHTLSWGVQAAKKQTNRVSLTQSRMTASSESLILAPASEVSARLTAESEVQYKTQSERLISDEDAFVLPNISTQISYTNAFSGTENVSLKYTVYHNKIEEDIIIHKKGDIESVSMNMDIGTLTPIVNSNGSVDLVDSYGVMQFRIGIPYMIDADFSVCNDIDVTAVKNGSSCVITYTPDSEWFESSERVYPILLDPSVTTSDYASNVEDTYVEENSTADHSSEQYLFVSPNGTNRRNAIIRIKKLPVVAPSMPIISANLTLSLQSEAQGFIGLNAKYYDLADVDLSYYDYTFTNGAHFSHTAYAETNFGSTTISFDFLNNIDRMYYEESYDIQNGYEYHGDFVISYSYDNSMSFPAIYSSEYTNHTKRPVFTVRYGYSLPAGLLDDGVYSFMNDDSLMFMSVNGDNPASDSNVYQTQGDVMGIGLDTTQKFKLNYVSSTGGYMLCPMSSSNGNGNVIIIDRAGASLASNMNVCVSSSVDHISMEWLIIPTGARTFKIVPRADMTLALTAYGWDEGSNTGTTSTSNGNIFVQTFVENNYAQQWNIFDATGGRLTTPDYSESPDTGYFYIKNRDNGKYLHRTGTAVNAMSGTIQGDDASISENTVKWHVYNLEDGYFAIQMGNMPNYYLIPEGTTAGSGVKIGYSTDETIPDLYRWRMRHASQGGILVQNKATGYYLYAHAQDANPSSISMATLNAVGTSEYNKQVWQFIREENYVEPNSNISFNNLVLDIDETKPASVNNPNGANWCSYTDFNYTISNPACVSYEETTHKFKGLSAGTTLVTAVHKTTGVTATFAIKVNKNAIIIVPGLFGSELFMGENNPYFSSGTPIISEEMIDKISQLREDLSTAQIVALLGLYLNNSVAHITTNLLINMFYESIECNDNGSSKYDVYTKKYVYVNPDDNGGFTLPSSYDSRYYTPHAGMKDTYYDLIKAFHDDPTISHRYKIEFFSYDWRLSNAVSAERLDDFIDDGGYDKVVLVAHSMGGLVSSGYMAMGSEQLNKVEEVYMLASPLEGAPEIINVWANTELSALFGESVSTIVKIANLILSYVTVSSKPLQKLFANYASMYELFPTQNYINISSTPYLACSDSSGTTLCNSYSSSMEILSECLPHFNSELMSDAEDFHNGCRLNNNHITYSVDCTYVCGVDNSTTIQLLYDDNLIGDSMEINQETMLGDLLVPKWSATLGRSGNCVKVYNHFDHTSIINKAASIGYLIQCIKEDNI